MLALAWGEKTISRNFFIYFSAEEIHQSLRHPFHVGIDVSDRPDSAAVFGYRFDLEHVVVEVQSNRFGLLRDVDLMLAQQLLILFPIQHTHSRSGVIVDYFSSVRLQSHTLSLLPEGGGTE